MQHLEELRSRLLAILAGLALAFILCLIFAGQLLDFLILPIRGELGKVYFLAPQEAFFVNLKTALFSALILSSPYSFFHIWKFLEPGLLGKEKKLFLPLLWSSLVLFVLGIVFAYFLVLPVALNFFLGFARESLEPLISVGKYISFLSVLCLGFGVTFTVPVFLLGLIQSGAVSSSQLRKQRPIVLIIILTAAAFFTPPDIFTQIALALPLWLLFEATLLVGQYFER